MGAGAYSVPVVTHRLQPPNGYDANCIGNLVGVQGLKSPMNTRNHAMIAPISVGTPAQQLSCLLDASSADLWLPSTKCTTCAADAREAASFFDGTRSSSLTTTNQGVTVVYGGGKARGLLVRDTVAFGSTSVPNQTFVLARDGDESAQSQRSWDGVCGIGWGTSYQGGGPMLSQNLGRIGKRQLFQLSPGGAEPGQGDIGLLFPGLIYGPIERQVAVWSLKSEKMASHHRSGTWAVEGKIEVQGGLAGWMGEGELAFETGTSYLLVPPRRYLAFMRTLLPNGIFERFCGVDQQAGNVVVCDCNVRPLATEQIVLSVRDIEGTAWDFPLRREDLFEEVASAWGGRRLCVPQVQQRPPSADLDSPYGVLGSPFEVPMFPGFGMLAPFLYGPAPLAFDPNSPSGEADPQGSLAKEEIEGIKNILGSLLGPIMGLQNITEVVSKRMHDGTTCKTTIVRAMDGKILTSSTEGVDANGNAIKDTKVICAETRFIGGKDTATERRLQESTPEKEVWVVGHVFMKRYSMFFDFEYGQVGFIRPPPRMADDLRGAEVDAFSPAANEAGAIQTFEAASTRDTGSNVLGASSHLMGSTTDPHEDLPPTAPPGFVSHAATVNHGGIFTLVALAAVAITVWTLRSVVGSPSGARIPGGPCPTLDQREPQFLEEGGSIE